MRPRSGILRVEEASGFWPVITLCAISFDLSNEFDQEDLQRNFTQICLENEIGKWPQPDVYREFIDDQILFSKTLTTIILNEESKLDHCLVTDSFPKR